MKFTLMADEHFVQSSDDLSKLTCNRNQFVTWWNGLALDAVPKQLTVKENASQSLLFLAAYKASGAIHWKPKTR